MSRGFSFIQGTGEFEDIPDTPARQPQQRDYEPTPLQKQSPPEPKKEIKPRRERFPGAKSQSTKPKTPKSSCPLTKEQKETKPPYAKDPDKWYMNGGTITIDENNTWTYTDWEKPPNGVSYPGGYPDFKSAGMLKQEVKIGKFEGYDKDFSQADKLAPNGKKADTSTWHHHQDGTTMQEVDRELHARFTHEGGMSGKKKSEMVRKGGSK